MNNGFPLLALVRSAIAIMTPLLFAATGGLFSSLAGMLNIALEGLLLAGAFSALAAFYYTGSFALSVAAAILASLALSALHAFTALKLRSNVFITGLAVNLFSGGLCAVLSGALFNTRGVVALDSAYRLPQIAVPLVNDIPLVGKLLSGHSLYVYGGWLFLLAAWLIIYKTPFGFRLRACEKHGEALTSLGIKPGFYSCAALLMCGLCCGIGGSFLSLNLGVFVPGMSAGRGWIALVVIFLGDRTPRGILAAAFAYGLADAFSNYAQGVWKIPADFILAFPYAVTFLAMVAVSVRAKRNRQLP